MGETMPFRKRFHCLFLPGHIPTTGVFAAFSTACVIGRIGGLTCGAGIVPLHFFEPLLVSGFFDPGEVFPQLDPVGPFRLKALEVFTGVVITTAAEINPPLGCAWEYFAIRTIG